jgi:hypothetical protein
MALLRQEKSTLSVSLNLTILLFVDETRSARPAQTDRRGMHALICLFRKTEDSALAGFAYARRRTGAGRLPWCLLVWCLCCSLQLVCAGFAGEVNMV